MKLHEFRKLIREEIRKTLQNKRKESFLNEFKSVKDFEFAIKHHEEGNPYYDETKLKSIFNQLSDADQKKAKTLYPKLFPTSKNK
jgi:hypothetical protein